MATHALLEHIDLVTFDTFGTLVDWRSALPALGVDLTRLPDFLRESERRQRPDRRDFPFLGYRDLLVEVGRALRPAASTAQLVGWARRFGELPFFADVRAAIALIGATVDTGVVSNCAAVHQIDIARRLGRPWDITVVAEEIEAYKPSDKAWDRAVGLVEERGYDRVRWLHVSAFNDFDIQPAGARGIHTAYVPRPGGVEPPPGAVDLVFDDLLQLARALTDAKGGPVAYEVEARAATPEVMRRYVEWMRNEHLADVHSCRGVRRAELVQLDDRTSRSVYRFTSRAAWQRYLERDAPRLRARGQELFRPDEVEFVRTNGVVRHAL